MDAPGPASAGFPEPGWAPRPAGPLANWTQRGLAYLLDVTLLLVLFALTEPILTALAGDGPLALVAFGGSATFLYFLGFTLAGGRTPGKRAFRLRTAALDGSRPNGLQSVMDALSKTLLPFLLLDLLAGLATARGSRQRLVQRAGGLIVLFDPPAAPKRVVFVP